MDTQWKEPSMEDNLERNALNKTFLLWGMAQPRIRQLVTETKSLEQFVKEIEPFCPVQGNNYLKNSIELNAVNMLRAIFGFPP